MTETRVSLCDEMRARSADVWDGLHAHPFLRELAAGTLPLEKFRFFLEQDNFFLVDYGRCLALGASKSRDETELRYFTTDLMQVLDAATDARLSRDEMSRIRELTRIDDGWRHLKLNGIGGLPQGEPAAAAERLLTTLAGRGFFLVPVGELERWEPAVSGHGPSWVVEVLTRALHARPDAPARPFIERVAGFFE